MSYLRPTSRLTGLPLALICGCALASRAFSADDTNVVATADAPSLLSNPASISQLRPPISDTIPATASVPADGSTTVASNSTPTPAVSASLSTTPAGPIQPSTVAADSTAAPSSPPDPGEIALAQPTAPPAPPATGSTPSTDTAASADPAPSPAAPPASSADPSSNAWKSSYVNLINLLVNRGVLTKKDSSDLVTQAEHDAQQANSAKAQAAAVLASPAAPPNPDDDTMRVGYVPETVKEQMRDEIKQDVMKQARDEHWAVPDSTPEWVKRYHVSADLRIRYEGQSYPDGNDDVDGFHNFNAINTGSPVDLSSGAQNSPFSNVDQNRNRFRFRARIGAGIDVGDGFTAGLRVATGSDNNPVTENQTFGAANNGQGGDFSKYSIWLDRAFLKYEIGGSQNIDFSATLGRFDNPFFGTSMIWADDLAFDGFVAKGKYKVTDGVTPFLTAGAFPVFNTDLNFGTYQPAKFSSEDKWLYAVQAGTDWKISHDFDFKGAVAYYDYENIQGKVSDSFIPLFNSDSGNTDDSRPSFAQNGNTYIALRNIDNSTAANGFGATDQFQYFGLATTFHELAVTGQLDYSGFDPFHVILIGEIVKNVAFDRSAIESNGSPNLPGPVNNGSGPGGLGGSFDGGDTGYNIRLTVGHPTLEKLWDWNVNLTYRYVESDAVVDGFTDSDFGGSLTGTNLQGYIVGGNLALTNRVWTSLRWMSADAIAGPPYKNDLIQVDINAKF